MMNDRQRKHVAIWLFTVCIFIFSMVFVGGVTRLTHSGLSIVEWAPLKGAIPPLNENDWNSAFDDYKKFPEYKIMNKSMTLSEFKYIFYWEYFHRLLARLIGTIYLLPFLFFYFKKYFNRKWTIRLFIGFILGGLQGLMGWLMVASGLVKDPHVSHYRLAAHLALAFAIAAYLFWTMLDILNEEKNNQDAHRTPHRRFKQSLYFTAGICLQIIYGAFTAGTRAGFGYNTFPKMDDYWFPPEILSIHPLWLNFLETNAAIQFTHRLIAFLLFISIPTFLWFIRKELASVLQKRGAVIFFSALLLQITLGILTILFIHDYSVLLPSIHQCGAFVLFFSVLFFNYTLYRNL